MLPLLLLQAGTEAQEILQQEESGTSILELITYGLLVGAIVWLIKEIVGLLFFDNSKPPVAVPSQQQQRPKPPLRDFTADELRQYDGLHGDQVYVSILGTVYDVSSRRQFYGPGGPYHLFAGHEAARALALGSLEEKDITNTSTDDLTASEKEALNDWIGTFQAKYEIVGRLIPPTTPPLPSPDQTQ